MAAMRRTLVASLTIGALVSPAAAEPSPWSVDAGLLAGFSFGYRRIHGTSDGDGVAHDLRLQLGVSARRRHPDGRADWFAQLSVLDLALVAPSAGADDLEAASRWTDVFEASGQVGIGLGRRVPLVLAATAGWAPSLTFVDGRRDDPALPAPMGGRGAMRVGVMLAVHLPIVAL